MTINGAAFSEGIDLGPIDWLMEKQHYDISDKQGRWPTDVVGLVDILEREKGLVRRKQKPEKRAKKYLVIPLVVAVLVVFGYLADTDPDQMYTQDPVPIQPFAPISAELPDQFPDIAPEPEQPLQAQLDLAIPDIVGYWHDDEGDVYEISDMFNGYFVVNEVYADADGMFVANEFSPVGIGQFFPDMPRKFALQVEGYGYGEYSVTADGKRLVGWFYSTSTTETHHATLGRLDSGS